MDRRSEPSASRLVTGGALLTLVLGGAAAALWLRWDPIQALLFGSLLCMSEMMAEHLPSGSPGSGSLSLMKHWGFLAKFLKSLFWTPPAFSPISQRPWKVMTWSMPWLRWQMSRVCQWK